MKILHKYLFLSLTLIFLLLGNSLANGPLSHVEYSTYIGGTGLEHQGGMYKGGMTKDNDGNIYIIGMTQSTDYPTTAGAVQEVYGGSTYDCYVSKFDPTLTTLLASTYLGGIGLDYCADIEFSPQGTIYIGMNTTSSDLPVLAASYDIVRTGWDTYIAELDTNLSLVLSSTYFGGTSNELYSTDLEFAADGSIYFTSASASTNLPGVGVGISYQSARAGSYDIYVAHMDSGLTTLLNSTYLGGTAVELYNNSLLINNTGDIVVRGHTRSSDFPTTVGAYDTTFNSTLTVYNATTNTYSDGTDITLSVLNPTLTTLKSSTYFGGSQHDYYGYYNGDMVVDGNDDIYLVGTTRSSDFPVTPGAIDVTNSGTVLYEAFISNFTSDLSTLKASTFMGSDTGYEMGSSIALNDDGNLVYLGSTTTGVPVTTDAYDVVLSSWDNVLGIISPDLTMVIQMTYVGGSGAEYPYETDESLLLDGDCVYFTAATTSTNFPLSTGSGDIPYQSTSAGSRDHTVTKMCPASCGDNVVQAFEGEECDDENALTGDGCSATCKIERCGDGLILAGEECDDTNAVSGDGCSDTCQVEYCRDDAPLNDTSKNLVVTDLTAGLISGTSTQVNSEVAICFEDTTGTRDIFFTTTDASGSFSYSPNLAPYATPWVNVGVMLHNENGVDIDHQSLILLK